MIIYPIAPLRTSVTTPRIIERGFKLTFFFQLISFIFRRLPFWLLSSSRSLSRANTLVLTQLSAEQLSASAAGSISCYDVRVEFVLLQLLRFQKE